MLELAWTEASGWVGELERPQEVGSLLEVGANCEDLDLRQYRFVVVSD
jgi:hypothetical protein